jgi:hypothetical protein
VNRFRPAMLVLFTSIIIALVFFGAQLQVPTALAVPGFTAQNPVALGANTCAGGGCHSGTATAGGSVVVTGFPAGMTYTPGAVQHLSVTVTDPTQNRRGFELTARLASALQAGTFATPTGSNSNLGTNGVQVVQGLGNTPTFTFDWTAPAAGAGAVTFYATGLAGSCCSGDGLYTNMYTLTPAAAATPPTITSFTAAATSITAGTSTTLTAVFSNGTGSIDNGVGSVTSAMPVTVSPAATTTYTLTVTGGGTTVTQKATVTVGATVQPPTISSFGPAAATITAGNSTTLTAVFSGGTGTIGGVGTVTSGTPVSVTPSATTTYTLTVTNSAATPPTVTASTMVTVNPSTGTGTLAATPASLAFTYRMGGRTPSSKTLAITSTSGPTSYSATETDPWLSITPTSGNTPGNLRASINPAGMAAGTYGAQINITTPSGTTITVPVSLTITSGSGGGGTPSGMNAQPYVSNSQTGTLAAAWVDYLGASPNNSNDPLNRALVLATSATSPAGATAGAAIQGVSGMNLTELSFDFRAEIPCTSGSPQFLVVTMDGTTHTYGGCKGSPTTLASSAPAGWTHVQFDLTQAPSTLNSQVRSISLVLQQGSSSTGSIAVIDNIQINKVPVGKGTTAPPTPRDD